MRTLKFSIYIIAWLFHSNLYAEIYQWTDEDGKVHYGDKKDKGSNSKRIETKTKKSTEVDISDYREVGTASLAPYSGGGRHHPFALKQISLTLPGRGEMYYREARPDCLFPGDMVSIDFNEPKVGEPLIKALKTANYDVENALGSFSKPGSFSLEARIRDMAILRCSKMGPLDNVISENAIYMRVDWLFWPPTGTIEPEIITTEGSYSSLGQQNVLNGFRVAFSEAFASAGRNLFAESKFVVKIKPVNEALIAEAEELFNVKIEYGNGIGDFEQTAEYLRQNSVLVQTNLGHGSGVLVGSKGYLLTNAHVVQGANTISIRTDAGLFKAEMLRINFIRDVALLKVKASNGLLSKGVKVSRREPRIGESIFVIGAPLDPGLSDTITKGIISAKRQKSGQWFLQTDAAINVGNSGGPVFNDSGELVALAVSGLITNEGASLNVNFLIPIEDALSQLNISDESLFGKAAKTLDVLTDSGSGRRSSMGIITRFFGAIYDWLNEPIM